MYKVVNKMKPCRDQYREQLIREGISEETLVKLETHARNEMESAYEKSKTTNFTKEQWMTEEWAKAKKVPFTTDYGVELEELKKIGMDITKLPED